MIKRVGDKYSVDVRFFCRTIRIGTYEYRGKAMEAEAIALKIRSEIDRQHKAEETNRLIGRFRFREAMAGMKNMPAIEAGF